MPKKQCGICCIEIEWEDDRMSVIPALRTFSALHEIPFKQTSVSTSNDFARWLTKWTELPSDYGILYISSHGFPGGITLHDDDAFRANVRLPQIADALEQTDVDNAAASSTSGRAPRTAPVRGTSRTFAVAQASTR